MRDKGLLNKRIATIVIYVVLQSTPTHVYGWAGYSIKHDQCGHDQYKDQNYMLNNADRLEYKMPFLVLLEISLDASGK